MRREVMPEGRGMGGREDGSVMVVVDNQKLRLLWGEIEGSKREQATLQVKVTRYSTRCFTIERKAGECGDRIRVLQVNIWNGTA